MPVPSTASYMQSLISPTNINSHVEELMNFKVNYTTKKQEMDCEKTQIRTILGSNRTKAYH